MMMPSEQVTEPTKNLADWQERLRLISLRIEEEDDNETALQELATFRDELNALAEEEGTPDELAALHYQAARASQSAQEYAEALPLYEKALIFWEKAANESEKGKTLYQIGNVYFHAKEYEKTLNFYQQAIDIQSKTQNYFELANTYFNMGTLHVYMEVYETAVANYEQCISNGIRSKNYSVVGDSFYMLRQISHYFGNILRSIQYFEDKLQKAENTKQMALQGFLWHELGLLYEKQAAEPPAKKAGFLGKLFGKKEEPQEPPRDYKNLAFRAYDNAIRLKSEHSIHFEAGESHLFLALLHEEKGQKEWAFRHLIYAVGNMLEQGSDRNLDMALNSLRLAMEESDNEDLQAEAEVLIRSLEID
jgi:tetratricopeptide (TPR) repeat protein